MKLVLASRSPRRIELLRKIVKDFEIRPAKIAERIRPKESARANAERLAVEKARAVFRRGETVIGCDTLGELAGEVFGKPRNKKEAAAWLEKLSGRTHAVVSAFCVKTDAREITGYQITRVTFRKLAAAEIEKYVRENPVCSFAGGYAIQGAAKKFVRKIEGEIETVLGFPLGEIRARLF